MNENDMQKMMDGFLHQEENTIHLVDKLPPVGSQTQTLDKPPVNGNNIPKGRPRILTQELLWSFLEYNPQTGVFIWKQKPMHSNRSNMIGHRAGTISSTGKRRIKIMGKQYYADRLALIYIEGDIAKNDKFRVKHLDGDLQNDAYDNLQKVYGTRYVDKEKAIRKLVRLQRRYITTRDDEILQEVKELSKEIHRH